MSRSMSMLCLCLALVASHVTSFAEPTPTIRHLMDESVSLLDWGLVRLGDAVQHRLEPLLAAPGFVSARYDWNTNRIGIEVFSPLQRFKDGEEARSWCRLALSEVRTAMSVNPATGAPFEGGHSYAYLCFVHQGYQSGAEPADLAEQLDDLIDVVITVPSGADNKMYLRCKAPLIGTEILFGEVDREAWLD
jgi:hypothetical protein